MSIRVKEKKNQIIVEEFKIIVEVITLIRPTFSIVQFFQIDVTQMSLTFFIPLDKKYFF